LWLVKRLLVISLPALQNNIHHIRALRLSLNFLRHFVSLFWLIIFLLIINIYRLSIRFTVLDQILDLFFFRICFNVRYLRLLIITYLKSSSLCNRFSEQVWLLSRFILLLLFIFCILLLFLVEFVNNKNHACNDNHNNHNHHSYPSAYLWRLRLCLNLSILIDYSWLIEPSEFNANRLRESSNTFFIHSGKPEPIRLTSL